MEISVGLLKEHVIKKLSDVVDGEVGEALIEQAVQETIVFLIEKGLLKIEEGKPEVPADASDSTDSKSE